MVGLDLRNIDDIDALTKMLKLTYSNEDWHPMIEIADKLYDEACMIYHSHRQQRERGEKVCNVYERPLLYYFGFSQLAKGISLQKQGKYKESRECIEKYRDMSWMDRTSDLDDKIINDFKSFSIGNTFTLDLLEGKEEVLQSYVKYITEKKGDILELLAGIITIFEAALKNDFNIDWIITEFAKPLEDVKAICHENLVNIRYFSEYLYLHSLYKFMKKNYGEGLESTLEGLAFSDKLKDNTAFKKNVVLFETFREHATRNQEERYVMQLKSILEGVLKDEKNISFSDLHPDYCS